MRLFGLTSGYLDVGPPLGPGGCVGDIDRMAMDPHSYEGPQSDTGRLDSEETGNTSWPLRKSSLGKLPMQLEDSPIIWRHAFPCTPLQKDLICR